MTKTLEQLQAEAQAAKDALEAANAQLAEAASIQEKAKQAEMAKALNESLRTAPIPPQFFNEEKHLQSIASQLTWTVSLDTATSATRDGLKGLVEVSVNPPVLTITETEVGPVRKISKATLNIKHRGSRTHSYVVFEAEMKSNASSFRSYATGRTRMRVSASDVNQSFPPKKDGTYNYESAAALLFGFLRTREQQYQNAKLEESNLPAVTALKEQFGLASYDDTLSVTKFSGPIRNTRQLTAPEGMLFLKLSKTVTREQAEIILKACVQAGVKLN